MAICTIGGLLLSHFSVVFNGTTAIAAIRSYFVCFGKAGKYQLVLSHFVLKVS